MKVIPYNYVMLEDVKADGAAETKIRWLIGQKDAAPNFAMRMFEVQPGGHTPMHTHPWEHEVFILEGEGVLATDGGEIPFKAWDVVYVDPNLNHQFKNTGTGLMRFLCMIPHEQQSAVPKKGGFNPFANGQANNC